MFLKSISACAIVCVAVAGDPALDYANAKGAFSFEGARWKSSARPKGAKVDRVVIHSTFAKANPKSEWFAKAAIFTVWRSERDSNGNTFLSVHYFIDRQGQVYQLVPEREIANHAKGFNTRSLGVELAGIADDFVKEAKSNGATSADLAYTDAQYTALSALLTDIKARHPDVKAIKHSEIFERSGDDTFRRRKSDPGSMFNAAKVTTKIEWTTAHEGQ